MFTVVEGFFFGLTTLAAGRWLGVCLWEGVGEGARVVGRTAEPSGLGTTAASCAGWSPVTECAVM